MEYTYSVQLEGVCLSQGIFMEFSICFGEWTNSRRKRERQSSTSSFSHTSVSIRKQPNWRETSWWLHCSSESTLQTFWETQWRCIFLDKIFQSAGSRSAILANEVICTHHPWHCARRLHLPSDFSKRRSSIIREARNTNASTHGYAEEQLVCAAAAYSQGRRK